MALEKAGGFSLICTIEIDRLVVLLEMNIAAKTVQGSALSLQSIDDFHGGHLRCTLSVGDCISDHNFGIVSNSCIVFLYVFHQKNLYFGFFSSFCLLRVINVCQFSKKWFLKNSGRI